MKRLASISILTGSIIIFSVSCKNYDDNPLLIDQNFSKEKIVVLMQESMTIKQLEEFTNVRNTKCGQKVLHEGETVLVYSFAESYNIYPTENRFGMKELDSVSQIHYNLQATIVGNHEIIFDKLIKKVGIEADSLFNSFLLFPVFVKGKIVQVDCGGFYAIVLYSEDLYIP